MDNSDLQEKWKIIPFDTKYTYQASNLGRVARVKKDGSRRILSEFMTGGGFKVGLVMADGSEKKMHVITIVSRTWLGQPPTDHVAYHKNGIKSDHRVSNICYIPRSKQIVSYNRWKRKPVAKINRLGEMVEVYPTASICAKENHFTRKAITNRCNGKYVGVFASDGFAYCYEDDYKKMHKIKRQIEVINNA